MIFKVFAFLVISICLVGVGIWTFLSDVSKTTEIIGIICFCIGLPGFLVFVFIVKKLDIW